MDAVQTQIELDTVEEAIAEISRGKVVIVVDDEDRENEGDFVCAAEKVTPQIINFMATHGRGLICAPITEERAKQLDLYMMVEDSTAVHQTAFTVSIDLKGRGCTTGISAYDRATGIRALTDQSIKPEDFARPGHIFPLIAKDGGVLRRTGHTEAAIDLAQMAGFKPAGVLVEILNPDGTMARLPQLVEIAKEHDLKIISIEDLIAYRMKKERLVRLREKFKVDSRYGHVTIWAYEQINTGDIHLAVTLGSWSEEEPVLVRVHSTSETGEILGSIFDDYGLQVQRAMEKIRENGSGVLLYMRSHEKEESLLHKLSELAKRSSLPHKTEQRDFGIGAQILRALKVKKIKLLTQRPKRRIGLEGYGLEIVENVSW